MSEQKYYVKDLLTGDGAWLGKDIFGVVNGGFIEEFRAIFTKSELAGIMDGALYKKAAPDVYDSQREEMGLPEWINPLIELVLVKSEE
ncbi:hypothetical protein [Lactococcus protaetiae]|uniref:Uncharacterized protein n=1 Tax=Lactococcus protaetiae TaxID=2592653 RepID=A0A514Z6W9_9LACT|nr:hypothetical protein [Lactococcus protaetiae]QDK70331.1 hypothetical protein FLP15_03055 [Lactococcus protaetiae]